MFSWLWPSAEAFPESTLLDWQTAYSVFLLSFYILQCIIIIIMNLISVMKHNLDVIVPEILV